MKEEFLHFLWRYRMFRMPLLTKCGISVDLIDPGFPNTDAGPDFFNAKLRMNGMVWAGNVEIHVHASEWYRHMHHQDPAYQSVILHVVYQCDTEVLRSSGEIIPVLELEGKIDINLYVKYRSMMESLQWIPCEGQVSMADQLKVSLWLHRIAIERLEKKSLDLNREFNLTGNDMQELMYRQLAASFGFKINSDAFLQLARRLPFKLIERHRYDWFQVEALIFGQAGFLDRTFSESYPQDLAREYRYLKNKYELSDIGVHQWKFLRMRPSGFPTIRLAQFSQLLQLRDHLFDRILEADSIDGLIKILKIQTSKYWEDHFHFDKLSPRQIKMIGDDACYTLIINSVIPFLFFYSKERGRPDITERALAFLELLPFEQNKITRKWQSMGLTFTTAMESQALIELKSTYCDCKNCLNCSIGNELLHESVYSA